MARAHLRRSSLVVASLAAVLALAVGACSSGGSDPDGTGSANRAVERLRDYGLDADAAECVVEELGAEAVVEAPDMNAFAESQQYRDAAQGCEDD